MSCVPTLRHAPELTANTKETTKGGGRRPPPFVEAAEGRLLCVGCEHWAYLSVETQDMCLVESQDICLVETQDMCCVGSLDKKEAFPKSLKREVNIAFDNHFEVTLGGILVAKGAWTNWPIHILVTLADSN